MEEVKAKKPRKKAEMKENSKNEGRAKKATTKQPAAPGVTIKSPANATKSKSGATAKKATVKKSAAKKTRI